MMKFNAELFRVATMCQSTEQTRYYLCGVFVEPHAIKGVVLTTTDGHRLLSIHDENGFADESAIISLSAESLKACKHGRHEHARYVVVDGAQASIMLQENAPDGDDPASLVGAVAVSITPKARVDGTFPDYRRVVPADVTEWNAPAYFNGAYLAAFAKIGDQLAEILHDARHGSPMRVLSGDAQTPALIRWSAVPEAFGVLMPMRGVDDMGLPAWFNAQREEAKAAE